MISKEVAVRYLGARKGNLEEYKNAGERRAYKDACSGLFDGKLEEIILKYEDRLFKYEDHPEDNKAFPYLTLVKGFPCMNDYWTPILIKNPFLAENDAYIALNSSGLAFLMGWVAGARKFLAEVEQLGNQVLVVDSNNLLTLLEKVP